MVEIRGVIPKTRIKDWLQNWLAFELGDRMPDSLPANSGPKNKDGIPARLLNKIMMDVAIKQLPLDIQRAVYLRWTSCKPITLKQATLKLGISKSEYYRRCDSAVDRIYELINGQPAHYANLLDEIKREYKLAGK